MVFGTKDPYIVLLATATNIPVLLMTGFVVEDHIYKEHFFKMKNKNKLVNCTAGVRPATTMVLFFIFCYK